MIWQQWFLAGFFALTAVVTVARVGQPRRPTEAGEAAIVIVIDALLIWCVVSIA